MRVGERASDPPESEWSEPCWESEAEGRGMLAVGGVPLSQVGGGSDPSEAERKIQLKNGALNRLFKTIGWFKPSLPNETSYFCL